MEFASPTQIEIKSRTSHGTVLAQAAFFFFYSANNNGPVYS
jgi:hypothetical protein